MGFRSLAACVLAVVSVYFIPSWRERWYSVPVALLVGGYGWIFMLFWLVSFLLKYSIVRQRTKRRDSLLSVVKENKGEFKAIRKDSPRSDDGDWEHVRGNSEKSASRQVSPDRNYYGFIGFFHPFANAAGGGERVLWTAIKVTQERWPNAVCIIYTGDHQASKADILERVKTRFDLELYPPTIIFLYLKRRDWVVASSYPRFTLLLQSLGSIVLAHEALKRLTPDVFIDTMGYAFSTWYCKFVFPDLAIGSYVHYPFIGTHMVDSLASGSQQGVNAGKGKGLRGLGKKIYWNSLLKLYTWTGTAIDSIMTNSSWTQGHMQRIWGAGRTRKRKQSAKVVYPPCLVKEIIDKIPLEGQHALPRMQILLCIAQFRPEKNHELLIQAFAEMNRARQHDDAKLVLIGSVRDSYDETLVYKLRLLAKELKVEDRVEFRINIPWDEILEWLKVASVGVNGMWCEHFGIGVVEYQAAGLISVVNDSGGPKEDIVIEYDGGPTGYHASTSSEYSARFAEALSLPTDTALAMRKRARASSKRFTTSVFEAAWAEQTEYLISVSSHVHSKQA